MHSSCSSQFLLEAQKKRLPSVLSVRLVKPQSLHFKLDILPNDDIV